MVLRSEYGISALEARHEIPAWEKELLLEMATQEEAAPPDDERKSISG